MFKNELMTMLQLKNEQTLKMTNECKDIQLEILELKKALEFNDETLRNEIWANRSKQ